MAAEGSTEAEGSMEAGEATEVVATDSSQEVINHETRNDEYD
jgi:hypothetical protein